jgi:signal transduction histidine kinase
MARTWSVPHRGSFAGLTAPTARHHPFLATRRAIGRGEAHRSPFLLMSALLTAIGIAVLNVDSQSLATMLLVAGAGLAAIVILFPGLSQADAAVSTARHIPLSGGAAATAAQRPAQFAELLSRPQPNSALDRAVWAKLTAHMSHELRTPLNAVLGFSELMTKEVFGPLGSSCYGDYARDIHASGRLLLKSAEDALAITALLTSPERKGPPQSCRLKSMLDDAYTFAHRDLETRSITVEFEIDKDMDVVGDQQAMRQMVINLIAEASRNARDGATLHIRVRDTLDAVSLSIGLSVGDVGKTSQDDGFAMILARTLCELSGARLATFESSEGGREWNVNFLTVAQNDLFLGRT